MDSNIVSESPTTVLEVETVAVTAPLTAPSAIEQGGRIELTDANKQELAARGLPNHRISNAAYGIRKCFGKVVTAERIGRTVSAYTVSL